MKNRTIQ